MADDLNRPYVGYRSAGRRPESQQDRRAAADAPLAALRGVLSGVLGAPGDIESLVRMLPGLSERTVLPTSADVERRLPLRSVSETPAGRAFTEAGTLGGGFYTGPGAPLRAIAAMPSAVSRAARDFAVAAGQPAVNVVKPKGGNWLAGSVERAIEPMQSRLGRENELLNQMLLANPDLDVARAREVFGANLTPSQSDISVNNWLEQKLGKYIRNEMATPEDPLRALAERGITHQEQRPLNTYNLDELERSRELAGYPVQGVATTPAGRAWEAAADYAILPDEAGSFTRPPYDKTDPWLFKVPPETKVYSADTRAYGGMFDHLVDELKNAINPTSGLPENLRWKYQDLDKVTVPQAVERVAKINEWRAAQKAEADMARAMNPATQVFKEYPEQGFKWVELRKPESTGKKTTVNRSELDELGIDADDEMLREFAEELAFDEGLQPGTQAFNDFMANTIRAHNKKVPTEVDESIKILEDALKYEGETMGHCVGGYCPDVVEGRSKIFSLRDKKGQPHVTIEVKPGVENPSITEGEFRGQKRFIVNNKGTGFPTIEEAQQYAREISTPEIVQIKGKANRAPNPEYLPAVRDFVRSGSFGRVGDLGNTGLIDVTQAGHLMKALQDIYGRNMGVGIDKFNAAAEAMPDAQRFMTKDELLKFLGETPPEAKAAGGAVRGYQAGGVVRKGVRSLAKMFEEYTAPAVAGKQAVPGSHVGLLNQWLTEQPEDAMIAINRNLASRKSGASQDYELRMMPVDSVKPTQAGEDYLNDSSRYTAKQHKNKDIYSIHRTEDALPIILDEAGNISDGNHRHAAAVLNGEKVIPALVPIGKGTGKVINLPERGEVPGFAFGGLVANSPTGDFDPARIDAIVDQLHAMNAG